MLRYLKSTINYGLRLQRSSHSAIHAYSDADWAGDQDDRRSTTVYIIYFGGNPISWS